MIEIHDPADPRIVDYTHLTDVALRRRREPAEGLFMAESTAVIGRAVAAGYPVRSLLTHARWLPDVAAIVGESPAFPVYTADHEVLRATTGFRLHRGPMAAMARRPLAEAADVIAAARRVLVLEGLVDHTNVGAAFRSAAAMGIEAVLVTPTCADPLYRRSVRVSMGTVFQVPWTRADSLVVLADHGFDTVALTPDPDVAPLDEVVPELGDRVALLVGTEGPGLEPATRDVTSHAARIPMAGGVDSLNVAAAVAVACYALTR